MVGEVVVALACLTRGKERNSECILMAHDPSLASTFPIRYDFLLDENYVPEEVFQDSSRVIHDQDHLIWNCSKEMLQPEIQGLKCFA